MLFEKWPIQPSFLSLRKGQNEETADLKLDGIYYPDYIRGFLADLSHDKNVQSSLTMFQVVPKDFTPMDENAPVIIGNELHDTDEFRTVRENCPLDTRIEKKIEGYKIIRIDSGTFGFHRACAKFRECCKAKDLCYRQDSFITIFADTSLANKKYPSDTYTENLRKVIKNFNRENPDSPKLKLKVDNNDNKRLYVYYTCKMSLLQETMFPIFVKERFVACLMLGQKQRKDFDKEKAFKDCPFEEIGCEKKYCEGIRELLDQKNISKKNWDAKINTILNRIQIFRTRLERRIDHRNNDYVRESFKEIRKKIIFGISDIKIRDNHISHKFYKALSSSLSIVHEVFGIRNDGFVRMFALPMNDENNKYIPIGWSNSSIDEQDYMSKCKDYVFTIPIEKDFRIEKIEGLSNNEMYEIIKKIGSPSIQKEYDKQRDTLIIKKLIDEKYSYIIWERDNNSGIIEDNNAYLIYEEALNNFYAMAFQNYAFIRGSFMEYMLETVISEATHESAHFTLPAIHIMENKIDFAFNKAFPFALFPEHERKYNDFKHYKDNVIEQILHLNAILTRPSIIFKDIALDKEWVQIHPLLFKMTKMMSDKAKDKDQAIVYEQNINYKSANLDKLYFDHAIFNLVDNAIKHGYDGTKIYIKAEWDIDNLIVKVINYGEKIEEGKRIYQLFERSNDKTKGMGLGLFVVHKICMAFGGSVDHESVKLSSFNIAALRCYKYSETKKSLLRLVDEELKFRIHLEAKRLKPKNIDEVTNNNYFIKGPTDFKDSISSPTFRNTFTMTIPI